MADPLLVCGATRRREAMRVRSRVDELVSLVRDGRIFEAIDEFYAPDVALGESALAPMFPPGRGMRCGTKTDLRDAVWRRFDVRGIGVNGDTSFVECVLEFETPRGERVALEQVAVAQWRDGRIVREYLVPN